MSRTTLTDIINEDLAAIDAHGVAPSEPIGHTPAKVEAITDEIVMESGVVTLRPITELTRAAHVAQDSIAIGQTAMYDNQPIT